MLPEGVKFWIWPCYRIEYMGRATNLPDMPGRILSVMITTPCKRWTSEELFDYVFIDESDGGPVSNVIPVHINILKAKLRNRGINPIIRRNGQNGGYTFIGFELYNNGRPWWA